MSNQGVDAFESGDQRRDQWIGEVNDGSQTYYFPFKYKIQFAFTPEEYVVGLRLAEQYLIRAEARAKQGDLIGAQSDLNVIRGRAGLPNSTANNQASLLLAIEQERKVELFTEWGHRWMDLKRTQRIDEILSTLKSNWQVTSALYPIPELDITNNPNITQNPGYQ